MILKKNQKFKVLKEKNRNKYGNIQAWVNHEEYYFGILFFYS